MKNTGHINTREEAIGVLRDGETCSTVSKSSWEQNYLLIETIKYEQADKDRQSVRGEPGNRLCGEYLGNGRNLPCPDDNGGGDREPIIMEIVRFGESLRGKESTLSLGADSYGTRLRTSAEVPSKTCRKL